METVEWEIDVKGTDLEVKRPRCQGLLFYLSAVLLHRFNQLSESQGFHLWKANFNSYSYNLDVILWFLYSC